MMASGDRRRSTLDWLIANPVMTIRPWRDEVVEQQGFDARHAYVETYWLPVLGPSAVLALRRFADWLDNRPAGAQVDLIDLGAFLGLGAGTGRHTQINRTIGRLIDFGMARICGDHLEVRTTLPPVPLRVRKRLPPALADTLAVHDRRCLDSA